MIDPFLYPDCISYWQGLYGNGRPPMMGWFCTLLQWFGFNPTGAVISLVGLHIATTYLLFLRWRSVGLSLLTLPVAITFNSWRFYAPAILAVGEIVYLNGETKNNELLFDYKQRPV